MKVLILALLGLAAVGVYSASAGNCTTRCTPQYGGGSVCNTYCY